MSNMFCFQCQQTAGNKGCVNTGVCGKQPETARLQDELIGELIRLATAAHDAGKHSRLTDRLLIDGLFTTLTNVNFDDEAIREFTDRVIKERKKLSDEKIPVVALWDGSNDEVSLRSTLLFGLKGMAAYAHHAMNLGYEDESVTKWFYKGLCEINKKHSAEEWIELIMEFGKVNFKCMELLDRANTETFGSPSPVKVQTDIKKGPFIVISGHDLKDLSQLLEQTKGKGINVYTHSEMLPAHGYPELNKYEHLAGNFGTAWQSQQKEFDNIPAPVLFTTNWGEYISDGSDDSLDTIAAFEDWYKATYGVPVKVNYDTYASNEDMYAKLKSGAVSYDVVIPSDYMIARMEAEDMLLPLNYDNIPNCQYISEDFRGLYYDPDDTYTVPYTYGIVGVIYNANVVDEADTGGWDLMWNPKYAGNILQFNNARDALGTAMYRAGIDVNTTDHADWQQALQALVDQRPLVKSYVMDEIYNMMESGEAAVAAYYAGDYFTMCDAQADSVDLQFYYPENTNYFIDAMCIPTSCRDQELAECFINFMLSREAAVANAEYIYYASPNRLVYDDPEYIDDMGEDTMAILYPDIGSFRDAYNRSAYRNLDQDTLTYVNSLWETLKIN